MSARVAVLGAGRVGSLIARDLARTGDLAVLVVDRDEAALAELAATAGIETRTAPLERPGTAEALAREADVVVGAVPGALGLAVLREVLAARRPVVDISFMPEDPRVLDGLAREAGVAAVVDCGVAPGLSNWLVGRSAAELETVDRVEIRVGGLPVDRRWPWEYRAVFSPADVVEEYLRPCRIREEGRDRVVPALSGLEQEDIPGVGTVEAFYTDGLRTLLDTIPARTLREKTLRWPGHAERVRLLRDSGFLDESPLEVNGTAVAPRAVTEQLLARAWEGRGPELTVLRVTVEGRRAGSVESTTWTLLDRTDGTGPTSMARTTGFPCAIVAAWLARGIWSGAGVVPPEILGRDAALSRRLLVELEARGVRVSRESGRKEEGGERPQDPREPRSRA